MNLSGGRICLREFVRLQALRTIERDGSACFSLRGVTQEFSGYF